MAFFYKIVLDKFSMLVIVSNIMNENNRLGIFLKAVREGEGVTLRFVEQQTGISNAYLSQLENGKIRQPSPILLHKLCSLYNVSYAKAMKLAGYPLPQDTDGFDGQEDRGLFARFCNITTDEEKELSEYLDFLRSKSRRRK